jgi:predicted transcriptional regulator
LLRQERKKLAAVLLAEGYSKAEIAHELGYAQMRSLARLVDQ